MKKLFLTATAIFLLQAYSIACTNFLVSKGASADGSTMITYTADSYWMYGELYHYSAAKYPAGTLRDIYEWDTGKFLGKILEASETYNVVGNMNEHQVVIGETTFGGRGELVNSEGIIDYGSLIYIALQRSKTAREAIKIMTDLVTEYGYHSSGESFSIADASEVWIMEMVGKGAGKKGAVWVAVKIPDGYISGHANQARITTFPLYDPDNCLYASDVITFAREQGYFEGKNSEFNFSDAYAPLSFGGIRFCDARVWSLFRRCNSSMEKYLPYIKGESIERMPLYIKPDKKLSVADVMSLMRDHYEGTELDMTKGIAAGPYSMPYRWRPLVWDYNGQNYFHERPISTPQTGFSFISQSRSWLPNEVGGVFWFGVDDTYMTVYTPFYSSMVKAPYNYEQGRASFAKFSWDAAFWVFNFVSNYVYPRYSVMIGDVKIVQSELEGMFLARQKEVEDKALQLSKTSKLDAVEFLNKYSDEMATLTISRWKQLGENLIAKYMDGISKDDSFRPVNIGYPEAFRKLMVESEGSKIIMKTLPQEIEHDFKEIIQKGEKLLKEKEYAKAKTSFEKALEIKPDDETLKEKIKKLGEIINKIDELHKSLF
ncbi:MAG: C69 family dipeptidase [Ignavibacteriaceae bacterium]|nr:C69 family dipeptidase [Ignavibacteriaceae bacterium]